MRPLQLGGTYMSDIGEFCISLIIGAGAVGTLMFALVALAYLVSLII